MEEIPSKPSQHVIPCILVIPGDEVKLAWKWFVSELHPRPNVQPEYCCIYDQKRWGIADPDVLLKDNPDIIKNIAILYITSQLAGNDRDILQILDENSQGNVCIYTPILDLDIRNLIADERRFRNTLSECLPFWVQLATIIQSGMFVNFALSLPNFHPEDKGPDGMSFALDNDSNPVIEIRSAKNSIGDPYYDVASAGFRNGGEAKKDNLLEEFHLINTRGYGFTRMDRLLSILCQAIGCPTDQLLRAGLLGSQKSYNAFVIANDHYARYEMFSCYHLISNQPHKCIATYIGSDVWVHLSENTRNCVIEILENAGVW